MSWRRHVTTKWKTDVRTKIVNLSYNVIDHEMFWKRTKEAWNFFHQESAILNSVHDQLFAVSKGSQSSLDRLRSQLKWEKIKNQESTDSLYLKLSQKIFPQKFWRSSPVLIPCSVKKKKSSKYLNDQTTHVPNFFPPLFANTFRDAKNANETKELS